MLQNKNDYMLWLFVISYFQIFSFLSFGWNADRLPFSCMWHVKSKGSWSLSLSPTCWRSLWLLVGLDKISEIKKYYLLIVDFEMRSWLRCLIWSATLPCICKVLILTIMLSTLWCADVSNAIYFALIVHGLECKLAVHLLSVILAVILSHFIDWYSKC